MNHISKIAKLLKTSDDVILNLEQKMNKLTGKTGIIEKISLDNDRKIKRTLDNLKLNNPSAEQVFNALIEQAKQTDNNISSYFKNKINIIENIKEITKNLNKFYLKKEKSIELLKLNPPQNILKVLNYNNIEDLLKKEDVFEIFCALRFIEDSKWLNNVFFNPYKDLAKDDFEKREIKIMLLPEKWQGIGQKFLGKKLHPMSHLKELGIVFIIPTLEKIQGEFLYLFFMLLHYVYEVDWHSKLFETYSQQDNFAKKIINILKVEVSENKLPNKDKISWRVINKYLAKKTPNDSRLFEPHINTEAWHYHKANLAIEKFSQEYPELGLDFWKGLNISGEYFEDILISFDMFDIGISLLQKVGLESRYLYHQQEALWTEIFRSYMGEDETDKIFMENLDKGFISL